LQFHRKGRSFRTGRLNQGTWELFLLIPFPLGCRFGAKRPYCNQSDRQVACVIRQDGGLGYFHLDTGSAPAARDAGDTTKPGTLQRLLDIDDGAQELRFVGGSQLLAQRIAASLGDNLNRGRRCLIGHRSRPALYALEFIRGLIRGLLEGCILRLSYILELPCRFAFLPSATEILYALGMGESVSGVTFECDYPPEARQKAIIVDTLIHGDLTPQEIDEAVRRQAAAGGSLYFVDLPKLKAIHPDVAIGATI
jgi:hypothetical protein